jgi:uncharacterized protein YjiS (DUF1127 family)
MTIADDTSSRVLQSTQRFSLDLASKVSSLWNQVKRWNANRQAMKQLREFADWQLADIGLTRSDLFSSQGSQLDSVSQQLNAVARERARNLF